MFYVYVKFSKYIEILFIYFSTYLSEHTFYTIY